MVSEGKKKPRAQIFADAFAESSASSLGRLMFWLPVLYFGRDIFFAVIDAISRHIH